MPIEILEGPARIITYTLLLTWLVVGLLRVRSVSGSMARYELTTLTIAVTAALIGVLLFRAVIELMRDNYLEAGAWAPPIVIIVYNSRDLFDDSNWFNDQFKKMKKGVQNLSKRLSNVRLPSLMPAPNPA